MILLRHLKYIIKNDNIITILYHNNQILINILILSMASNQSVEKKYVWIVYQGENYEGYCIDDIFDNKAKALKYARDAVSKYNERFKDYDRLQWVISKEVSNSITWTRGCNYITAEEREINVEAEE